MEDISTAVPLLDLKPQYESLRAELDEAVMRVVRSQNFILGPEVETFEKEAAQYCRTSFAIGVSSGTDALLLALMALDVGRDDEVITTPYTFFATAGSISRVGARPVFVDIEPDTFNIDPRSIARVLTQKTKAIMPVHLFGRCVDADAINAIADGAKIPVIEDAAQAIGAEHEGQRAGAQGTVGCFSFFPSKNLGAFGDAGMVTTSDPKLAERLRKLRVHGGERRYYHDEVGANFRIDALQAAVLSVKLRKLDDWTAARQRNADIYRELCAAAGLVSSGSTSVSAQKPIVLPAAPANGRHIYNQFVVRAHRRDELQQYLTNQNVGTAVYYPVPMHLQKCFESLGYKAGSFPESERAAKETLALPIFPELSKKQLEIVAARVAQFYADAA